jgi:NADH:ubiquinone oxidoreductase subunit D
MGKGFSYPILYTKAISLQKIVYDLLIDLTSTTNGKPFPRIGGVAKDFDKKTSNRLYSTLTSIERNNIKLRRKISRNIILKGLLQDVGFISRETARKLSLVGPIARASGITDDIRKSDPYAAYESVSFNVPVYDSCDLYGEVMVRFDEILESIQIVRQLLTNLPEGSVYQQLNHIQTPANNSLMRVETPVGELFSFAMNKKGSLADKPVNYSIISPIKLNIQGILSRLSGESFDNVTAILLLVGEGWCGFI